MTESHTPPAARAIARLNSQLLDLAAREGDVSALEVEKTAKAIAQLIRAVEQAEGYLAAHDAAPRPGARLSPERHRALMRRIRNAVKRGLLDEESGACPERGRA